MISNVYISCWMYMMHCRIELVEFWVKNAKSALQTRRNSLLAKWFANSEIPQMKFANGEMVLPLPTSQLLVGSSWGL